MSSGYKSPWGMNQASFGKTASGKPFFDPAQDFDESGFLGAGDTWEGQKWWKDKNKMRFMSQALGALNRPGSSQSLAIPSLPPMMPSVPLEGLPPQYILPLLGLLSVK